jgi:hypothetical protein
LPDEVVQREREQNSTFVSPPESPLRVVVTPPSSTFPSEEKRTIV